MNQFLHPLVAVLVTWSKWVMDKRRQNCFRRCRKLILVRGRTDSPEHSYDHFFRSRGTDDSRDLRDFVPLNFDAGHRQAGALYALDG